MPAIVQSPSAAVTRTLQALAALAGAGSDMTLQHTGTKLHILRDGSQVQTLACPARPQQILKVLTTAKSTALPALNHGWQFDATARQLSRGQESDALTEKESLLLTALLGSHPKSCSREQLLRDVWAMQGDVETHTLETHIYRLRSKLEALDPRPCTIVTVDGAYQLELEAA
ncbi:MAG: winged helix-turn-helix domain-containing protein [Gallionella sp.]|jgi:DNA-binding response OmpR family regulator